MRRRRATADGLYFAVYMMMEKILKEIRDFARKAHGDQVRKYRPERYINHPVRVMEICREYTSDTTILATALLHDVLEDTKTTKKDIKNFLIQLMEAGKTDQTLTMVQELTDQYTKKRYPLLNRYKRKAKEHERLEKISAGAQLVKYADIIDNTTDITRNDPEFAPQYISEAKDILRRLKKGNGSLRQHAISIVEECELFLKTNPKMQITNHK